VVEPQVPKGQKISAVLADVDGTLVTDDKVLTPRVVSAIEQLYQHGTKGIFVQTTPHDHPIGGLDG
jgi:hydroxymethylpyrimidine pyrophosphatase-like HAD family hydrolase